MWLIISVASPEVGFVPTITRPSCEQCDNPTWSHKALLSRFHTSCRSPFWLHNHGVGCWGGGALWRACNLPSFSPCLTGPVDYLFASCHKGPGFKSPGGCLCETGILLIALSRYTTLFFLSWLNLAMPLRRPFCDLQHNLPELWKLIWNPQRLLSKCRLPQ